MPDESNFETNTSVAYGALCEVSSAVPGPGSKSAVPQVPKVPVVYTLPDESTAIERALTTLSSLPKLLAHT